MLERKEQEKKKYRPYPLTTIQFQKLATSKLKMTSAVAMGIAEKLYQRGYISYPRTETNAFPKTFSLSAMVKNIQPATAFREYIDKLFTQNKFQNPKVGKDSDQAHTPIHPVKPANREELTA